MILSDFLNCTSLSYLFFYLYLSLSCVSSRARDPSLFLQFSPGPVPGAPTGSVRPDKVPSPLARGAAPAKDQCERVYYVLRAPGRVAFGNTEEWLHRAILG